MKPLLPALLFFLFPLSLAFAADKEPVNIRGDQVEYFDALGKVVATGNVEAVYRDTKLTCDRATIYTQTKDAYLEGRVRLVQMGGLLKGEEIIYNFETRKGTILQAEGEFGPWRTRGDRAEKVSAESVLQREGYLTSCDFEEPHTRMQAKQVRVFMDDKVVLKDVVMYVGSMPLFYFPTYTHLLDDKRPRVTIVPGKSKPWGLFLLTSWRVYVNENLQGRFHLDYRELLDLASGVDLNYRLPVGGEGLFRNYYTNQRELHKKHAWSSIANPDKIYPPTSELERYRFQLRHIWEPDESLKATLEYNQASDSTVIQDFFEREFEENNASPPSYFQVVKTSPWYGLTFLVTKRVNRYETVTQQLPSMTLNLRPIDLPWIPSLEPWINWIERRGVPLPSSGLPGWFYQSSFIYEHSDVADAREGTQASLIKFDSTHEISNPMRLLRRFNFRPFLRFRHSIFSRALVDTSPQFRKAGGFGFDLSSKLFRAFDVNTNLWNLNIHRIRHIITPTVHYEYQTLPSIPAAKLLRSDGLAKSNIITPSIEQKLQTKRSDAKTARTEDLARFIMAMPYDLEGSSGAGGEWQPLTMDLETRPYSWLRAESDAEVDPHIGKFTAINADLVLQPGTERGWGGRSIGQVTNSENGEELELPWAVGLGWRYQRNTSARLTFETEFNLGRKWRAGIYQALDVKRFATETSLLGSRTVKKIYDIPEFGYRLRRDLHEWTMELIYNVERGKGETVLVVFRLKAAPETPIEAKRGYHRPKAGRNFPKSGAPL